MQPFFQPPKFFQGVEQGIVAAKKDFFPGMFFEDSKKKIINQAAADGRDAVVLFELANDFRGHLGMKGVGMNINEHFQT
jgi:hypothetical protein